MGRKNLLLKLFLFANAVFMSDAAIAGITDVKIQNTSATDQLNVPITFGQVFATGHLTTTEKLYGKLADGSSVPLQLDLKATHANGSVRHAVISAIIPKLTANQIQTMSLEKTTTNPSSALTLPSSLVNAGFTTGVTVTLDGVIYSASADQLLNGGSVESWLSGAIADEWLVSAPLKTAQGVAHPHLTARFAVRTYDGIRKAKVDVIIENNWAYQAVPQNFTYDAQIQVGGQTVYSKSGLTHYHHARWKKTFWWGGEPTAFVRQNTAYLISTKAVPNYDQSVAMAETTIANLKTNFTGTKTEPMGAGIANAYMPTTGGRPDIGLLPSWAVTYLLSQDKRAYDVTLAQADLGGSWSTHYRDQVTDQPISLVDFPYMTLAGNPGDTYNPVTKLYEKFPVCGGTCTNPNVADISHQPNFAYLPYLTTGDHFYLEELQFWGAYNAFNSNPHYRDFAKGLLKSEQLRGQGWGLRMLSETGYITPDQDRLKSHFIGFVNHNLDWYNANYTNNASANKLGTIVNGYSISYNNSRGVAPWMDDFFTQGVGHTMDLGFENAKPLLIWKSKFQIGRMIAPGVCYIHGGIYALNIRDSETSPFYETLAQAYNSTLTPEISSLPCASQELATALGLKVGEMTGYSSGTEGYPSNYQPALAYAVDSGAASGSTAWTVFMSRSVKPNYSYSAQFNIIPRSMTTTPTPTPTPEPTPTPTPTPASCSFNGQTVVSGNSITAYLASTVPYGSTCSSQVRSCMNGVLSGTYQYASCSVSPAPTPTPTPALSISSVQATNDATNMNYGMGYTGSVYRFQMFLDTDKNASTGYVTGGVGAEYMIEGNTLYKHSGAGTSWGWTLIKTLPMTTTSTKVNWTVPRTNVGNPSGVKLIGRIYGSTGGQTITSEIVRQKVRR